MNGVRTLALANFDEHSRFFTLTFKENITDMVMQIMGLKNLLKGLNTNMGILDILSL